MSGWAGTITAFAILGVSGFVIYYLWNKSQAAQAQAQGIAQQNNYIAQQEQLQMLSAMQSPYTTNTAATNLSTPASATNATPG